MRSNQNLPGSTDSRVASKLSMSMPLEWLDAGSWRLPSGKALAEFALQAGFLAPLIFRTEKFQSERKSSPGAGALAGAGLRVRDKESSR